MVNYLHATLNYQNNCDYKESTTKIQLPIYKQQLTIEINCTNLYRDNLLKRNEKIENSNYIYYNDILLLTATVKYLDQLVKIGSIQFYYYDSKTNKLTKIGQEYPLNNNGQVFIKHIPHHDGYYYAKYINSEEEYFEESYSENFYLIERERDEFGNIPIYSENLNELFIGRIPTKTLITKETKQFYTKLEDSVELTAQVKDIYGEPVQYGNITFLTYKQFYPGMKLDGFDIPIGNPVPLDENGIAKIKYSPIQYNKKIGFLFYDDNTGDLKYIHNDDDDFLIYITEGENDGNLEISTKILNDFSLNYDDEIPYTLIAQYHNKNQQLQPLELIKAQYNFGTNIYTENKFKYYSDDNDYGVINIIQDNILRVELGTIQDGEFINNYFSINQNNGFYIINTDEPIVIRCYIVGTDGDKIKFPKSIKQNSLFHLYITGTDNDKNIIKEEIDGGYIDYDDDFCIYYQAYSPIFIENGYYNVYATFDGGEGLSINENLENIHNNINNLQFFDNKESYLLGIETQNILNKCILSIDSNLKEINKLGDEVDINIQIVDNDGNEISITEESKRPKIIIINQTTQEKIILNCSKELKTNYIFNPSTIGDYNFVIYATKFNINRQEYVSIDSSIKIKYRNVIIPKIKINSIQNQYPGECELLINIENSYKKEENNLSLKILKENKIIENKNFILIGDEEITVKLDNLDIGDYSILNNINNEIINFSIIKNDIYLLPSYPLNNDNTCVKQNKNIYKTLTGPFSVYMSLESNKKIGALDGTISTLNGKCSNNLYLTNKYDINEEINDNNYPILIQGTAFSEGLYVVDVLYENDSRHNFIKNDIKYCFEAITVEPSFSYEMDDLNQNIKLNISLPNEWGNEIVKEYIPAKIIIDYKTNIFEKIIFFNTNGESIVNLENLTTIEWQNIDSIIIELENNIPFKNNMKQSLEEYYECSVENDELIINSIMNQYSQNNYEVLFSKYKKTKQILK